MFSRSAASLTEREHVGLNALSRNAISNVRSVTGSRWRIARRQSVDESAKAAGRPSCCRSHDEMQVAGMKAVDDPSAGLVEQSGLASHRPVTPRAPTD